MSDTELQQLIIYVGTTAQIEAAIQAGIITENDLSISTDAPDFQEKLTDVQMNAVNSGITTQLVSLYSGHVANTTIHVTAQDKTIWNGKQNAINDLDTIRSNAQAGKYASDTISGYGNIVTHNVSEFATAAQGVLADTALQPSDVVDNTTSSYTNKPLSANMGKSLQDQIDNMNGRGRFLALWNCATGLAQTNPPQTTYIYKAGDYFIVGTVAQSGGTNYRPSGSSYTTGVPSTVIETEDVAVNDVYYYDGSTWALQINTQKEISFVNIAGDPYDNTNLASAFNAKQDELVEGTGIDIDSSTNIISNSGVRSVTTGSSNGTISVNTGGTTENVSVYGLGSSAYTPVTDYATASQGSKADTAVQPADLNNYVTLNTVQRITSAKSIVGMDATSGDSTQANIFSALSTQSSTQPDSWKGRIMVGAKNVTFLMGAFNGMAGLGAHSWTDSAAGSGAAWDNVYINPDGDKTVFIGGYAWRKDAGWFRVQNTGSNSGGKVQVNNGTISGADWKDVAYKGENISDFNNDSGFITSSALNGYATESWVGQQGYITGITSSDVTTALGYTPYDASNPDGYLQNTATGSNSLTISGLATSSNNSVVLGYSAGVGGTNVAGGVAVGQHSIVSGNLGTAVGGSTYARNSRCIAIGWGADASAVGSIQIGNGVNSDAGTLQVSLSYDGSGGNLSHYQLLTSGGKVPVARYITMTGADGVNAGATGSVPAPSATDNAKFLRGDGTWANVDLSSCVKYTDIVSSVDVSSTNNEAVGAKLFYDTCGDIETLINAL